MYMAVSSEKTSLQHPFPGDGVTAQYRAQGDRHALNLDVLRA